LPSVTLGKPFAECFLGFAECRWHSANLLIPVVLEFEPSNAFTLSLAAKPLKEKMSKISFLDYWIFIAFSYLI